MKHNQHNTPSSSDFEADDRGNVVDFYDIRTDERVAKIDREAEVDGKPDQLTFENWSGGPELESWMQRNGYDEELKTAAKL